MQWKGVKRWSTLFFGSDAWSEGHSAWNFVLINVQKSLLNLARLELLNLKAILILADLISSRFCSMWEWIGSDLGRVVFVSIHRLVRLTILQEIGTLFFNVLHSLVLNLPFDVTKLVFIREQLSLEFFQVYRSFRLFDVMSTAETRCLGLTDDQLALQIHLINLLSGLVFLLQVLVQVMLVQLVEFVRVILSFSCKQLLTRLDLVRVSLLNGVLWLAIWTWFWFLLFITLLNDDRKLFVLLSLLLQFQLLGFISFLH